MIDDEARRFPGAIPQKRSVLPRRFVLVVVLESGHGECGSVGVLRQVRIAPRDREVGGAEGATDLDCY